MQMTTVLDRGSSGERMQTIWRVDSNLASIKQVGIALHQSVVPIVSGRYHFEASAEPSSQKLFRFIPFTEEEVPVFAFRLRHFALLINYAL